MRLHKELIAQKTQQKSTIDPVERYLHNTAAKLHSVYLKPGNL